MQKSPRTQCRIPNDIQINNLSQDHTSHLSGGDTPDVRAATKPAPANREEKLYFIHIMGPP
jgi:hypothetical protein